VPIGECDDGQVGRFADLEAARGRLGTEGPGPEKSGHRHQQLAGERFVLTVEESQLVEQAERVGRRQAVRAQTDDHTALEEGAIGMRRMAESGMGPGTIGDGDALVVGRGLWTELPEVVGLEIRPVGDQPVGVPQFAAADVIGRARTDRLPLLVPGPDLLQESPHRAVLVREQAELLGHLREVGRQR
jgi:hypothetical protein